jgi:hypothetical protein
MAEIETAPDETVKLAVAKLATPLAVVVASTPLNVNVLPSPALPLTDSPASAPTATAAA